MVRFDTLDHIGILTADAGAMTTSFTNLGLPVVADEHFDEYNVRVVFLKSGDMYLELLEPTGSGLIREHYDEYGEGYQHVAYRVDDIDAAVGELREQGVTFEEDEPRAGAGESRIIFIDPTHTAGLSVELVELLPGDIRL